MKKYGEILHEPQRVFMFSHCRNFHANSFLAFMQKNGKKFLQRSPFRHRHYDSVRDSLNLAAITRINHLKHIRDSEIVTSFTRYIFAFRLAELIADSLAGFCDFGNLSENEIPDELVRNFCGCAYCYFSVGRADSDVNIFLAGAFRYVCFKISGHDDFADRHSGCAFRISNISLVSDSALSRFLPDDINTP